MTITIPEHVTSINTDRLQMPRLAKPAIFPHKQGKFVMVRKAGEDVTRLGLMLGEMPISVMALQEPNEQDTVRLVPAMHNPCIYVFDTCQLVYGIESWWGEIETEGQLRQITDGDIDNVWYVKALKQLQDEKGDVQ